MTEPVFICFSQKNSIANKLSFDLYGILKDSVNQNAFYQVEDLLQSLKLKIQNNQLPVAVILDIDDNFLHARELISRIRQLKKNLFILAIGKSNVLSDLQRINPEDFAIQYLPTPYSIENFHFAINAAITAISIVQKLENLENSDKQIEEKVNESLQKLIDANMAKDQFLSIIAHDLKSPFHALLGVSDMLLNDWENLDDEHKLELIADIRRTSSDTFKLLTNLLEWTKIQKEKLLISIDEVIVHELVEATLKISHNHMRVKGIKVKNEISNQLKVHTDENMMATVFRNLISNAVQYTQPGGKINISAYETSDGCTFCVADNGEGIEKTHILDYFKKGNRKKLNGNATAFKGLGLLICKDFVEKNGGEIWLETEKGQGSKFYFTVPC
jgi:signal transduction histidine kinase